MSKDEKVKQFFEQLKDKEPTVQGIRNAAAATGDIAEIIPVILNYAAGMGIDAAAELADLIKAQDTARQEAALKETAASLAEKSGALAGETDPEKRRELVEGIRLAVSSLEMDGKKNPFVVYEEYRERRAARKYWETFSPALFNNLPFTDGDLHLIGARSGAGKTNALINIMRELLLTTAPQTVTSNDDRAHEKNAKRRIIFISREMDVDDIIDRLTLSIAWGTGTYREILEDNKETFFDLQRFHTAGNYPDIRPAETYQAYNDILDNYISPAMKSGRLVLYDALDAERLEEILNRLAVLNIGQGDVVLVDYVQLLPAATGIEAEKYGTSADHLRMRYIVHALRMTAKKSRAIFICAAQLNRPSAKEQSQGKKITETSFQDSASLEQAAHSAVILDRNEKTDPPSLSYYVVKARSSWHLGQHYALVWEPGYYYLTLGEKITAKQKTAPINEKQKNEVPVFGRDDI